MRISPKLRRTLHRVGKELGRFWNRRIKGGDYAEKVSRKLKRAWSRLASLLPLRGNRHKLRTEITNARTDLAYSSHSVHDILGALGDVVLAQSRRLESQETRLAAQQKLMETLEAEVKMLSRRIDPANHEPTLSMNPNELTQTTFPSGSQNPNVADPSRVGM